jgi:acetyl esterase/lipase
MFIQKLEREALAENNTRNRLAPPTQWQTQVLRYVALNLFLAIAIAIVGSTSSATTIDEPLSIPIWPDLAPGETSRDTGTQLPTKPDEVKPIARVSGVRRPTLDVYPAKNSTTNAAVLILPGGGFTYVVPDLEGSEAAPWLNDLGFTVFVLRYRTKEAAEPGEPLWKRPLEDTQRAMRFIRHQADRWQLRKDRIGLLAFSAGGQVGAIAHAKVDQANYTAMDAVDQESCKPDFSMLIYPWQMIDPKTNNLLEPIQITDRSAPAFIVHTHDDASSSVGAAKLYIALKENKVPAELHVYQTGGHGYGLRDRPNSVISSWPGRATEWLKLQRFLEIKN